MTTGPRAFSLILGLLLAFSAAGCGESQIDWEEDVDWEETLLDAGAQADGSGERPVEDDAGTEADGTDASTVDAGLDAEPADAGEADPTDAGETGSDPVDAGVSDAGWVDAGAPDAGPVGPLKIFVAPTGNDARSGLTLANAVLTLGRVQAILKQAAPARDVEVRIAPGRYQGQKVSWSFTMPSHRITFMPLNDDKVRPVFDGCLVENVTAPATQCPGGTWFILDHKAGQETNLHFEYLRVERYQTAISLNGQRDAEATNNGSNRLFGCYFSKIGNVFNPALTPSTAAVRLVNSDDNEIVNNHFVDIVNTTSGGLLHAIYAAHLSDRNLIQSNRFERGSGDPVRLRDYSNDNRILQNRFIQIGAAGYSDWYCDHEVNTACTKPAPECPSWRNQFRDNTLDGDWSCDPLRVWVLYQDDATAGCTAPSGAARVSTSGNVQVDPPCAN